MNSMRKKNCYFNARGRQLSVSATALYTHDTPLTQLYVVGIDSRRSVFIYQYFVRALIKLRVSIKSMESIPQVHIV